MIWVFGDSWAEGYGLKEDEKRFSDFLSEHYQTEVTNLGMSASSMGQVAAEIFKNSDKFRYSDVLIAIIPPDVRWYKILNDEYQVHSLYEGLPDYEKFLDVFYQPAWFTYHHSLFIYSICQLAHQKGMVLLLAHNYGKLKIAPFFESLIDNNVFLSRDKSLVHHLSGEEMWKDNFKLKDNYGMRQIDGEYFIPRNNHPNEAGHKFIANLITERFKGLHSL